MHAWIHDWPMVSRDGFETWFDYQVGIYLLVGTVFAVAVVWYALVSWLGRFGIPTSRFALYIAGGCLVALVFFLWLAGRVD